MSFRGREFSMYSLFEEIGKQAFKPFLEKRYEIKRQSKATVHKNSHIQFSKDKHYYSVPYQYIGKRVKVIYSKSIIEIYHQHKLLAQHTRERQKYSYTTTKEHMPSQYRFVSEWSSEKFISWDSQIGEYCQTMIIKTLDKKQHPEQSYKSCLGILHMAKKVREQRLDNACKRALEYHTYSYKKIDNILKKDWDQLDETIEEPIDITDHKNIRGSHYYK